MRLAPLFVLAVILSNAVSATAEIRVAAPRGNLEPAILDELRTSLEAIARELPASPGKDAELRVSMEVEGADVSLEVVLLPDDGAIGIRETRLVSRASALPQARAMARSVLAAFASRAQGAPSAEVITPVPSSPPAPASPPPKAAGPPPAAPQAPATGGEAAWIRVVPSSPQPAIAPSGSDHEAPPAYPGGATESVRNAARAGIVTGFSLDVAGLLGVIVTHSVVLYQEEFGRGGLVALGVSGGALVLATAVSSSAFTVRHTAYARAGFDTKPAFPVGGWMLSVLTVALYSASMIKAGAGGVSTLDDFWWGLGNAMTFYVAIATEALNFGLVRTLWRRDLRRSAPLHADVDIAPVVLAGGGGRTPRPAPGLALYAAF